MTTCPPNDRDEMSSPVIGPPTASITPCNPLFCVNSLMESVMLFSALDRSYTNENLHEQNMFFTTEEHEIIESFMLLTYLENVFIGKKPYVRKPIFGRNGGAITLYEKDGTITLQDKGQVYWDQAMIYQEKVS